MKCWPKEMAKIFESGIKQVNSMTNDGLKEMNRKILINGSINEQYLLSLIDLRRKSKNNILIYISENNEMSSKVEIILEYCFTKT
jgi:hypothetical protein